MKTKYVVGFLFTKDREQVVLIEKLKPAWQKGLWNGVGGKVEEGELWEDAMCREFFEETGVKISGWAWQHTVTLFNDHFECRFFRAFRDLALDVKTMEEEVVCLHPVRYVLGENVPLMNNLRWLIPLQLDMGLDFPIEPIQDGP